MAEGNAIFYAAPVFSFDIRQGMWYNYPVPAVSYVPLNGLPAMIMQECNLINHEKTTATHETYIFYYILS